MGKKKGWTAGEVGSETMYANIDSYHVEVTGLDLTRSCHDV